jgi:hypothetical protein
MDQFGLSGRAAAIVRRRTVDTPMALDYFHHKDSRIKCVEADRIKPPPSRTPANNVRRQHFNPSGYAVREPGGGCS